MSIGNKVTTHRGHDERAPGAPKLKATTVLHRAISVPNEVIPGDVRRVTDPPDSRFLLRRRATDPDRQQSTGAQQIQPAAVHAAE